MAKSKRVLEISSTNCPTYFHEIAEAAQSFVEQLRESKATNNDSYFIEKWIKDSVVRLDLLFNPERRPFSDISKPSSVILNFPNLEEREEVYRLWQQLGNGFYRIVQEMKIDPVIGIDLSKGPELKLSIASKTIHIEELIRNFQENTASLLKRLKKVKVPKKGKTHDRDLWMLQQDEAGYTHKDIRVRLLPKHQRVIEKAWTVPTTDAGVGEAIRKMREKLGKPQKE